MSRKERRGPGSQNGLSSIVMGTAVTIASVACYGAAHAVAKHFNREGQNQTLPPYIARQIEDGALFSDSDDDDGNEDATELALRNGCSDLDELSAAQFEGTNIEKLMETCDSYRTSRLVEMSHACATELKDAVENKDYRKMRAYTDMQQVLDKLLQVHRQQKIAHKEMNTTEIKRLTEEVVKRVKELKKCQNTLRMMYPSDEASSNAATRQDEESADWISSWFGTRPSKPKRREPRKHLKTSSYADTQRSTRQSKVASSSTSCSVASATATRKKKNLCRVEFCEKVADGARSGYMCRRHFRLATEAKSDEDGNDADMKPAALVSVEESGDEQRKVASSSTNCSVASAPSTRKKRKLCSVEFCEKISDGARSGYMCRRHFRLATEAKSDEDDDAADMKPAALACVEESGDEQGKVASNSTTCSVASAPAKRKKRKLCSVEFCEKISDGARSGYMCRRHFRLATEAKSEEDDDAADMKPAALACVEESGDDISQLGESQETSCFPPFSQPDNLKDREMLDGAPASVWKNTSFMNYPKDRCCHCDEKGTEEAQLYECTCKGKLECRRLWHMDCQNQVLRDTGKSVFLSINRKTFHCSECRTFEMWNEKDQLKFLLASNDDADDDDEVSVSY